MIIFISVALLMVNVLLLRFWINSYVDNSVSPWLCGPFIVLTGCASAINIVTIIGNMYVCVSW